MKNTTLLCGRVRDGDGGVDAAEGVGGAAAQIHGQHTRLVYYDGGREDTGVGAQLKLHACPARAQLKDQLVGLLGDLRLGAVRIREGRGTKAHGQAQGGQEGHPEPSLDRHGPLPSPQRVVDMWVMTPQIRLFSWLIPRIRTVALAPRGGRPRLG